MILCIKKYFGDRGIMMSNCLKSFLFTAMLLDQMNCLGQEISTADKGTAGDSSSYKLKFIEFTLDRVYPIQSFKDNLNSNLWGVELSYLVQLKKEKFDYLGLKLNLYQIDNDSNILIDSEVSTSSNFVGVLASYRHFLDFYFWKIEPFVELKMGAQFFYTQTTTSFFDVNVANDIQFNEVDTGIAYSGGLGFMVHITNKLFLVSQLNYFSSSTVTYLVNSNNQFPFPIDNFVSETSQANFLKLQIGLTFSI